MKKIFYTTFIIILLLTKSDLKAILQDRNDESFLQEKKEFYKIIDYYENEVKNDPNNIKLILSMADVYYSFRDYNKAVEYYSKALALRPNDYKIKKSLALSYLNDNDLNRAQRILNELYQIDPKDPDIIGGLGRAEALKRNFKEAEDYYNQALDLDPNHMTTLFYLGELEIERKNFRQAQKILSDLANRYPNADWVQSALKRAKQGPFFEKIDQLKKVGDYAQAVTLLKNQLVSDPKNTENYLALAKLYSQMHQYKDAIQLLKQAKKQFPEEVSIDIALAFTYLEAKDLARAEVSFENILEEHPKQIEALAGLGKIAMLRKDRVAAEAYYKQALELNRFDTLVLSFLADLKMEEKDYVEAEKIYETIEKVDPTATWVGSAIDEAKQTPLLEEIRQKEQANQFSEVEKLYEQLINQFPNNINNVIRFANYYKKQKRFDLAIALLEKTVQLFPKNVPLQESLAYTYMMDGRWQKAQQVFETILKTDPLNAESLAGLGKISLMAGDIETAKQFYALSLKISPDNITALSFLSDLQREEKDYTNAAITLKKIIKIEPKATWARQSLVQVEYGNEFDKIKQLETLNQWNQALSAYQELQKKAPDNIDIYQGIARAYIHLKDVNKAIDAYRQGLKNNPNANALRVALGLTLLEQKEYKEAKTTLEAAYQLDPKNEEAIAGIGKLNALHGDKKAAYEYYQTALKVNPDSVLTLSYLAEFYIQQKEFVKAQNTYKKILELDPSANWAKNALSYAQYAPSLVEGSKMELTQNYEEAIAIYQTLLEKNPQNTDAVLQLGSLFEKLKKYDEAIILYQKALLVDSRSIPLQVALGFANLYKKNFDIAKAIFEKVQTQDSKNAESLAGLGRYYELTNKIDLADKFYKQALQIEPNNITALVFQANLYMQQNQFEKAGKIYEKLAQIQPGASWIPLAISDAKNGPLIQEIKKNTENKDFKKVEILYQQLLLENPRNPFYYLRFGLFYNLDKQYEKAIDMYLKGLKIDDKSSELYAALGLSYISKKEYESAKSAFLNALEIDPNNADALAGLGFVALVQENEQLAENLIGKALKIDPDRIAALSAYGKLLMQQKKYPLAETVYKKLLALRPNDKWVKIALEDAQNGYQIDEIHELIIDKRYIEAATIYQKLLEKNPDNAGYYVGLGQMYMRLHQYRKSAEINLEGLKRNPDENILQIALGYAYFFNDELTEARFALMKALEKDKKDPEALAGLARVNALEKNYDQAEELFLKALEIDPKNLSALNFYSDLLMKEKRYQEAQSIYANLEILLPNEEWVPKAMQDAIDGPTRDIADRLANKEEYALAANLYKQLVYNSPNDASRYLPLGQMYVYMQCYCKGIYVFEQGLQVDPESWFLWREIGFTHIILENFLTAQNIFVDLLENDPDDAESLAGLRRIQAVDGTYCLAESYYDRALSLAPSNLTILSFLADLLADEQYYFSALETYETIDQIVTDRQIVCETKPKWLRRGLNKLKNLTYPTITIAPYYHEEDQWDFSAHRVSAEYLVYGGRVQLNYPIYDNLTVWGSFSDQMYSLKDLLNRSTIYSFDVQRYYLGAKCVINPCLFVDIRAGLTHFSPARYADFVEENGLVAEPSLVFTYHQPYEKATFGFSSSTDLVARNFSKNRAKIVPYYYLLGTYERRIIKRGWIGFEADAFWYCDYVNNNSQRLLGWFQWRPPYYSDNINFRYITKFQTFAKNIPDYYTYKPQFINQLQVTLEKDWRVCWADTFYTSLSYSHGWQNTHTRFPQIIVVQPTVANPPYVWDDRQFNIVVGTIIYKYDQIQCTFTADYYRDTEKYTIWNVAGEVTWRF